MKRNLACVMTFLYAIVVGYFMTIGLLMNFYESVTQGLFVSTLYILSFMYYWSSKYIRSDKVK